MNTTNLFIEEDDLDPVQEIYDRFETSRTLYVLTKVDEVLETSFDDEYIEKRRAELDEETYSEACDEYGKDMDDLSPREAAEVEFMQGYNGDVFDVETFDTPCNYGDEDEVAIKNLSLFENVKCTLSNGTEVEPLDLINSFVSTTEDEYDEEDEEYNEEDEEYEEY